MYRLSLTRVGAVDCAALAKYVLLHKADFAAICHVWADDLESSGDERRIALLYLINEILQQGRRRFEMELADVAAPVLERAMASIRDTSHVIVPKVERVIDIWRERTTLRAPDITQLVAILKGEAEPREEDASGRRGRSGSDGGGLGDGGAMDADEAAALDLPDEAFSSTPRVRTPISRSSSADSAGGLGRAAGSDGLGSSSSSSGASPRSPTHSHVQLGPDRSPLRAVLAPTRDGGGSTHAWVGAGDPDSASVLAGVSLADVRPEAEAPLPTDSLLSAGEENVAGGRHVVASLAESAKMLQAMIAAAVIVSQDASVVSQQRADDDDNDDNDEEDLVDQSESEAGSHSDDGSARERRPGGLVSRAKRARPAPVATPVPHLADAPTGWGVLSLDDAHDTLLRYCDSLSDLMASEEHLAQVCDHVAHVLEAGAKGDSDRLDRARQAETHARGALRMIQDEVSRLSLAEVSSRAEAAELLRVAEASVAAAAAAAAAGASIPPASWAAPPRGAHDRYAGDYGMSGYVPTATPEYNPVAAAAAYRPDLGAAGYAPPRADYGHEYSGRPAGFGAPPPPMPPPSAGPPLYGGGPPPGPPPGYEAGYDPSGARGWSSGGGGYEDRWDRRTGAPPREAGGAGAWRSPPPPRYDGSGGGPAGGEYGSRPPPRRW